MKILVEDILEKHLLEIIADLEFSQSSLCFDPEANVRDAILKLRSLMCLVDDDEPGVIND